MVLASLSAAPSFVVVKHQVPCRLSPKTTAALQKQRTQAVSAVSRRSCKICALRSTGQGLPPPKKRYNPTRKNAAIAVTAKTWDQTTSRCVEFSTVAFIFLLMPQVIKNYLSMSSGNSEALAVLSWVVSLHCGIPSLKPAPGRMLPIAAMLQGYLTSLFGNVLLLGCFVDKQEGGATAVQAIGALANYAMLTQVYGQKSTTYL